MSTTYPAVKQSFTNPAGTSLVTSPDHAGLHSDVNDTVEALQDTVGTTAGTSVLKNFAAGDFPARINSSNVLQQTLQGTINNSIIGTPAITGGTLQSGLVGTSTITGGTINTVKKLTPVVGTLVDSVGTITHDMNNGQISELTIGTTAGNRTLASASNPVDGQFLEFRIKQNAAATGTIVWASTYRMSSEIGTPTLGTAATWNYYGWRYNNTDTKWDFQGQTKNII